MKTLLYNNRYYLICYLIVLGYEASVLLTHDKVQIHRQMNAHVGNPLIDYFFMIITHLGDGIVAIILAFIISIKNVRMALYIILSYLSAGVVSYILKHWVYYDITRPHFTFQYFVREPLNLVDGVDILALHSFPSGHSLSAFALFFCLLFMSEKNWQKMLYFILAILAAYSRVHLSQHWLVDIFVGSIIGVSFSIIMYVIFYKNAKFHYLDKGIRQLVTKQK